jgi:hypothetical protein
MGQVGQAAVTHHIQSRDDAPSAAFQFNARLRREPCRTAYKRIFADEDDRLLVGIDAEPANAQDGFVRLVGFASIQCG